MLLLTPLLRVCSLVLDVADPRRDHRSDSDRDEAEEDLHSGPTRQIDLLQADDAEDDGDDERDQEVAHSRAAPTVVVGSLQVVDAEKHHRSHGQYGHQADERLDTTDLVGELVPAEQEDGDEHGQSRAHQVVERVLGCQVHGVSFLDGVDVNRSVHLRCDLVRVNAVQRDDYKT